MWRHLIYHVQVFQGLDQQVRVLGMVQEELIKINDSIIDEKLMKAIKGLLEYNAQISEVSKHQLRIQTITEINDD